MDLVNLTLAQAFGKLDDWQNGRSGGFVTGLFDLMGRADPQNFKRLAVAFPALAQVYKMWSEEDGAETILEQQSLFGEPKQ